MTHHLKTWPQFFEDVKAGRKTFEVRRDDRDFAVGDILHLLEYDPINDRYGSGEHPVRVTYIVRGEPMPAGWCAMGIAPLDGEIRG